MWMSNKYSNQLDFIQPILTILTYQSNKTINKNDLQSQ